MRPGKLLPYFLAIATLRGAGEQRSFDVASVRPASPDAKFGYRFGPGSRFVATDVRLKDLLMLGWRLQSFQIGELPGWMESQRFNVEARAEGTPDEDEFRLMIQSLLSDRFRLQSHIETKESLIYSLRIARTGIKTGLARTKENECIQPDFNGASELSQARTQPVCAVGEKLAIQNDGTVLMRMHGVGVTMDVLARALGTELARHVENDTKLSGSFDFSFDFAPDSGRGINLPAGTRFDSAGPALVTALEEKLGLQLRPGRGNVEMLVVDHAERPSEN